MGTFSKTTQHSGKTAGLSASRPYAFALEPRLLFDGAAAAAAVDAGQADPSQADAAATGSYSADVLHALAAYTPPADGSASDSHATPDGEAADAPPTVNSDTAPTVPMPVELRPLDAEANGGKKEVAFIDSNVADYQTLVDGIRPGVEVELIDGSQDGLAQMAEWAEGHSGYDAIHVLSHSANGSVNFGINTITSGSLADVTVAANFTTLGQALTPNGDLLLYGCSVASDDAGLGFLTALATTTGADIAASNDTTGKGGDWILESTVGTIDTSSLTISSYEHPLAGTTLSAGDIAVLGMNSDSVYPNQTWAFVPLVDLSSGTVIQFTDLGVDSSLSGNQFYINTANEGTMTWTVPSTITAGTTLIVTNNSGGNASIADISSNSYTGVSGSLGGSTAGFLATGDQIIVYQGTADTTVGATFVYAINTGQNGTSIVTGTWITSGALTGQQYSYLPSGLTEGTSAIALTANNLSGVGTSGSGAVYGFDNMKYNGITSGTKAQLLAAIGNPANWVGDNTNTYTFSAIGNFTFTAAADATSTVAASATLTEPSTFATTATSSGTATQLLDFTIADPGTSDSNATVVTALTVDVTGTTTHAERGSMVFLLNGPDATDVQGTYDSGTGKITFSSLSISVANSGSETYTVSAYYNDSTSSNDMTEGHTLILTTNAANFTIGSSSSTMAGSQSDVSNGSGAAIDVTATQLVYATAPAGSVSGAALTTQPVVQAVDARGNVDTGFTGTVALSEASAGSLSGTTSLAATAGVATFSGISYTASADQETFVLTAAYTGLTSAVSSSITSDVVATKLLFSTQPVPTSIQSGSSTSFTTVPVVSAVDANNTVDTGYSTAIVLSVTDPNDGTISAGTDGTVNSLTSTNDTDGSSAGNAITVTQTPSSGVATFGGLALQFTNVDASESIALKASSGSLTTANSSTITSNDAPSVSSINRASSPTVAASTTSVDFTVTFSQSVTGVDSSDFTLTKTGTANGSISSVTGSGTTWTVTVNTLAGDGTLRLDLNSSGTGIQNGSSVAIASGYTSGQTYTLDHTAPSAPTTAIDLQSGSDSGTSNSDDVTKTTNPTVRVSLTGTSAAVGDTLELLLGGASLGTAKTKVLDSTDVTTNGYVDFTIAGGDLGSDGGKTLTAKVTDAAGNVGTAGGSLTITLDTTNPAITINNGTPFAYTENASAAALDASATVTEAGSPGSSVLTVQITANNEAADTLSLPTSTSSGINIDGSNNLRSGTTNIGTVTASSVTNGTTWTITFLSSATQQNIQDTIAAIRYHNTSDNPGTSNRTVSFNLTDGAGNAMASAATRTIAVTAVNDAPTAISPTTGSVSTYDSANYTVATLGATDADHSAWTFAIQSVTHSTAGSVTNTNGAVFDLGTSGSESSSANVATATLRAVDPSALTAGTYTVTVRATDTGGLYYDQAVTVTASDSLIVTVAAIDSTAPAGVYATDFADGGGLDLREALALASAGGKTIGFAAGLNGSTINLGGTYTVAAGTTFDADAVGTLTISGQTLTLAGAFTVTNGTGDTLTINSNLADNGTDNSALTKTGAGTLVLGGTNSTASTGLNSITVSGGTLQVAGDSNLSTGGSSDPVSVTLANGATLKVTSATTVSGSPVNPINNKIHLGAGGGTLEYGNTGGTLFVTGWISGGDLTKTGAGQVYLWANYSNNSTDRFDGLILLAGTVQVEGDNFLGNGTVTLDGGTLYLGDEAPTTIDNAVIVGSSGGTVTLITDAEFSGQISGSGNLVKNGGAIMTLSYATGAGNTHSGNWTISAGTLAVTGGKAIGDASAVTLSGSGVFKVNASETIGALTGNGSAGTDVTIASGQTLTATYASDATLAGVIGGAGGFAKAGAGTLTLSGANTYTGATTVSAGGLTTAGAAVIADGSAVTVASGATLTLGGNETIGSLSGAGNVVLGSNTLTAGGNGASTTFSGTLSGTGGLAKAGSGTLTLSGNNTYTGATTVSAGTLETSGTTVIDNTSAVTVASGASLSLGGNETIGPLAGAGTVSLGTSKLTVQEINGAATTFSGKITGAGSFEVSGDGTGTLTLDGTTSDYTGETRLVSGGKLTVSGGSAIPNASAVRINSGTLTLAASEQIGSLTSTNTNPGSTAKVDLGSFTLTVGDANSTTFPGVIVGTGNLVKTGTGTLTLAGVNTYTGTTTVSAGTLAISPDSTPTAGVLNGSGAGAVTVSSGATLAGSGTINSALFVDNGATLSPGIAGTNNGVGKLAVNGNLRINGTLVADIKGATTAGTDYDQVAVTGTVEFNGGPLTVNLASGYTPVLNNTYVLVDNDGTDAIAGSPGTFSSVSEGSRIGSLQASYKTTVNGSGNDFTLTMNNTPPTAGNGTVTTNEDTAYAFTTANFNFSDVDTDPSVSTFTKVQITALPAAGTLKLNGTAVTANQEILASDISAGKLTFLGAQDANGTPYTTFSFKVHDGAEYSASAYTLTVNVNAVNDGASISGSNSGSVTEDGGTTASGQLNVTDPDTGENLFQTRTANGSYGSFNLGGAGSWSYTLNNSSNAVQALAAGQSVSDTFIAVSKDGSASTTVTLTINGANDAPTAANDSATAAAGGGNASGNLLSNDTDVDSGDSKSVSAVAGGTLGTALAGSYGSLTVNSDGSYSYAVDNSKAAVQALKDANSTLQDSFTYTVKDGGGLTATATLTVTIQGRNDAPVAVNDSATAVEAGGTNNGTAGTNPSGNVLSNDTDPDTGDTKTVSAVAGGTVGTALAGTYGSLTLNSDGSYSYVLDNSKAAVQALKSSSDTLQDSFSYTVQDAGGLTGTATLTVTIQGASDAPTAAADSYSTDEDKALTIAAAQGVLANDSDVDGNTLSAVLVQAPANGKITLNADGSFSYTPTADFNGTDSFTYKANDGALDSNTVTVSISVGAVNDAPSFSKGADQSVLEDAAAQTVSGWASAIKAGPSNESTQTVSFIVSNDNSALFSVQPAIDAQGKLTYTPAKDANGTATVTVTAKDSGGTANGGVDQSAAQTFTITVGAVNDAPSFSKGADQSVLEDAGAQSVAWATAIKAGPSDESTQTVSFSVSTDKPELFSVQPAIDDKGNLTYTPAKDANGSATLTVTAKDSGGTANGGVDSSTAQTFTLSVGAVNDAPSFTAGANQTANEDAAAQTVAGWATAIKAGPSDESSQTVSFSVSADKPELFSVQPAIDAQGNLTYTPAKDANGKATVTVIAKDSGGTANGGVDQSAAQTFTIDLAPVNDAPSFNMDASLAGNEDSGAQTLANWAKAVKAGPTSDESTQTVSFTVTNDNNALFSVQPAIDDKGNLSYTPAKDASGKATVTVIAKDSGGVALGGVDQSAAQTFTIDLAPVNDAPSFTAGADQKITEDAAAQSLAWASAIKPGPAEENGQAVTFVVSNDNNALFSVQPSIDSQGKLSYTPAPDANGKATVTVSLRDNGGTANGGVNQSADQTFTITVLPVNDAPSFTAGANQTANEDAGSQTVSGWASAISAGPSDESKQTVSFAVTNDNNALFSVQPSIDAKGNLSYTPAKDAAGVATVTVIAKDDGGIANGGIEQSQAQTFTITVNPANDAPSFTAGANQTVNEDAGSQSLAGWASAISAGPSDESQQTVSFTVTNDNSALFSVQPAIAADGTLTYTPAKDANGKATITVIAKDDGGKDSGTAQTFTIEVKPVNDAPSFQAGGNPPASDTADKQTITGWAQAISAGPANESGQTVSFLVSNDNPSLFSVQPAIDSLGNLSYTPAANAAGQATVSVVAQDNGGTANGGVDQSAAQTFTISVVTRVNQAPSFTKGANQAVDEDAGSQTVAGWAGNISPGPASESNQTVSFIVGNDNPALFSVQPAIAADGTLAYTPAPNANGKATVTVVAQDNGGTAQGGVDKSAPQTFTIDVAPVNDVPTATTTPIDGGVALANQAYSLELPDNAFQDVDGGSLSYTATLSDGSPLPAWLSFDAKTLSFSGKPNRNDITAPLLAVRVTATDTAGASATLEFSINLSAGNKPPNAVNDNAKVSENGKLSVEAKHGVLLNDNDPDKDDSIIVAAVNGQASLVGQPITVPGGGLLTLNADGSYSFDTNGAYLALQLGKSATETVQYTIKDSLGLAGTAELSITITGENAAPKVEVDKTITVDQYTERKEALGNTFGMSVQPPSDLEDDSLTITVAQLPSSGVVTTDKNVPVRVGDTLDIAALQALRYSPTPGFTGAAGQFVYHVDDGHTVLDRSIVINVKPVQYLDVAVASATLSEGTGPNSTAFTFTVTRSGNTSAASTVTWQVDAAQGAGLADAKDFAGGALPTGTVSFAPGETSKTISVPVAADGLVESAESFTVRLASSSIDQSGIEAQTLVATADGVILNDDTLPVVKSVSQIPSGTGKNHDRYFTGDTLVFEVKFDHAVTVSGAPALNLIVGTRTGTGTGQFQDVTRQATLSGGSGTDTLRFEYKVQSSDVDPNGIQIVALQGGTVADADGNAAVRDFATVAERTKINTNPGVVIDGYFSGSTVFADADRDGVQDPEEASDVTDSSGNFVVLGGEGPYLMVGGTDISTNLPFEGVYAAPPRAEVITPLTTLLVGMAGMDASDAQYEATQAALKTALGIDASVDILSYDPFYEASRPDASAEQIALALDTQAEAAKMANLLVQGSAVLTGAATAPLTPGQAGLAINQATADYIEARPGEAVDLADPDVVAAILNAAAKLLPSTVDSGRVDAVASDAANVIGASNAQVDAAAGSATGVDGLTQITQAQVVAQGDAADALQSGVEQNNMSQAVKSFTGASLRNQVRSASVGTVVPVYLAVETPTAQVWEGDGGATPYTFTVTRSGNTALAFDVNYSVTGDVDGADFVGGKLPSGSVHFDAGQTEASITLQAKGDTIKEADESFTLSLSGATASVSLQNAVADGTIRNDDPRAPTLTLPATPSLVVGVPTAIPGIRLEDADSATLTVTVQAEGGTVTLAGPAAISRDRQGVLTVSGSLAEVNATLDSLAFTGAVGQASGSVRLSASDGDTTTADAVQTLSIDLLSPPEVAVPSRQYAIAGISTEIIGVGVADLDNSAKGLPITVTLTPENGSIALTPFGAAQITALDGGRLQIQGLPLDASNTVASLEFTAIRGVTQAQVLVESDDGDARTGNASDIVYLDVLSPPEISLPAAASALVGQASPIPGIQVDDFDSESLQVSLSVDNGSLEITPQGTATLTQDSQGYRLFGSIADVNATLDGLRLLGEAGATAATLHLQASDLSGITPAAEASLDVALASAPSITLPAAQPGVLSGSTVALPGVSVQDADANTLTVTLLAEGGSLTLRQAAGSTVQLQDGTWVITGAPFAVNNTLTSLSVDIAADANHFTLAIQADDHDPRTPDAAAQLALDVTLLPQIQLPSELSVIAGKPTPVSGISLSDTGSAYTSTLSLSAQGGQVTLAAQGQAQVSRQGDTWTVSGTAQDVNATLASLQFTADAAGSAHLDFIAQFGNPDWPSVQGSLDISVLSGLAITSQAPDIRYTDTAADDRFAAQSYTATAPLTGSAQTWSIQSGQGGSVATLAGQYGTLSVAGNTYTYTPSALAINALKQDATDSFVLQVKDGNAVASQTLSIALTGANDTPQTRADSYSVREDSVLNISAATGLLANDSDRDGDALTASLVQGPTHGTLDLNSDGSFRYTPDADYHGQDSFSYQAEDGDLQGPVVTVSLAVASANDAPVAQSDAYSALQDSALTISVAKGVLANDSDSDGDALAASLVQGPAHGTLALNRDGSFRYMPEAGYHGSDSFSYQALDGVSQSHIVTVALDVVATNPAIQAQGDHYSTLQDTALAVNAEQGVLANDSSAAGITLTATLVEGPAHGSLRLNSDGSFSYTPAAGYQGSDSFRYQANDGAGQSPAITVSLNVGRVAHAPLAQADAYSLAEDGTLAVTAAQGVLANDSDQDGDALSAFLLQGPTHGTLNLNSDGSFNYTPAPNYQGQDSFRYQANDGSANSAAVTVTLTVESANDIPSSRDSQVNLAAGSSQSLSLGNFLFRDADGDSLQAITVTALPQTGSLTLNGVPVTLGQRIDAQSLAAGLLRYTATATAPAGAQLGYTVSDGHSDSAGYVLRFEIPSAGGNAAQIAYFNAGASFASYSMAGNRWETAYGNAGRGESYAAPLAATQNLFGQESLPQITSFSLEANLSTEGHDTFTVPAEALLTLDSSSGIRFEATLANGQSLPPGLVFDAGKAQLTVQEGAPLPAKLTVKITATDGNGNSVVVTVKVKAQTPPAADTAPGKPAAPTGERQSHWKTQSWNKHLAGKPAFSEQLRQSGQYGMAQRVDALLDSVAKVFGKRDVA
jgi:VCBS repeat-containing protein/autotransporter-associated beta strand protein